MASLDDLIRLARNWQRLTFAEDGTLESSELLGGGRRRLIRHLNQTYCLSLTRHNKLILTK